MTKRKASSASSRRGGVTRTTKRKQTAKRRRAQRSTSRARKSKSSSLIPRLSFSRERKVDLLGVILVGVGLFTFWALFSSSQGIISGAWLDLLRRTFGWGMYVVPIAMVIGGAWVLLRSLGDRLPRIEPEQIIGTLFLYFLTLVLFQVLISGVDSIYGLEQARLGRGGGVIGATILTLLIRGFGGGGTVVILLAWFLVGVIFISGRSVADWIQLTGRSARWLWGQIRVREPRMLEALEPQTQVEPSYSPPPRADEKVSLATGEAVETPQLVSEEVVAPKPVWKRPRMSDVLEPGTAGKADETFDRERAKLIEETLLSFGAPAKVVEINRGPVITQFGVEPDFIEGRGGRRTKVKVSKISSLTDDLALAMAAPSIRIEAPVPGKGFVGIEVPNTEVSLVALREVMESKAFQLLETHLRLGLGMDVSGRSIAADLTAMPHLLIAGTTGSGKSVCVNSIVSCLLLQNTPDQMKFVMVDPKRVELTYFNGIPHLMAPVVVELDRVVPALQWVSREMDRRYHLFAKEGVRNIEDYNRRMEMVAGPSMYFIVVVIDELADLMMLAPDETERVVTRLAQLARATGIHLVIATQRPSVDVVTGLIKANFPARIAFAVASSVDSRVILDQPGAERLLGRGDMLFQAPDASAPVRMQGAFVSEAELNRLIRYWKNASLGGDITHPSASAQTEPLPTGVPLEQVPLWEEGAEQEDLDPLFDDAVEVVRGMRRASISLLQRRLRIGYTRSARLVDHMEERGIIGPAKGGSRPREVLDYGDLAQAEEKES